MYVLHEDFKKDWNLKEEDRSLKKIRISKNYVDSRIWRASEKCGFSLKLALKKFKGELIVRVTPGFVTWDHTEKVCGCCLKKTRENIWQFPENSNENDLKNVSKTKIDIAWKRIQSFFIFHEENLVKSLTCSNL